MIKYLNDQLVQMVENQAKGLPLDEKRIGIFASALGLLSGLSKDGIIEAVSAQTRRRNAR